MCVTHPHRILHHTSHPSAHQYTPVIASGVVARVHIVFKHSEAFNNVIRVSLTVCVTTPSRPKPLSHPTHPCRAVAQSTPLHPSKRSPKALFSPPQQPPSLSVAQSPTQSLPLSPLAEPLPKARLCSSNCVNARPKRPFNALIKTAFFATSVSRLWNKPRSALFALRLCKCIQPHLPAPV